MNDPTVRVIVQVQGVVQGVGFRPTVCRLATRAGLGGWVQNGPDGVVVALEGPAANIEDFLKQLPAQLPTLARVDRLTRLSSQPLASSQLARPFVIRESSEGHHSRVGIPADVAVCADCAREVLDPANRRYRYPFTTCTNCGPRYTIVNDVPYDRQRTTMVAFPLCPECRREYEQPGDRRFHAENIACPTCGPRLRLTDPDGRQLPGDALTETRRLLAAGSIVAIRGIGGFLLAANAHCRETLMVLRDRKRRPHKPFAVMAADLAVLRRCCEVSAAEAELLASPAAPIVILPFRPDVAATGLPTDLLTPDAATLGAMLPNSPLHLLLFATDAGADLPPLDLLVMTSGNRGGEPLCISNDEAYQRLRGIADYFLCHDREINLRNDDSLAVIQDGAPQVWRRARGYAPYPITVTPPLDRCVLALGAELKNTIALGADDQVVVSPHIGDLDTPEALDGFEQVIARLPRFLGRSPAVIAHDLHPDLHSTVVARRLAAAWGIPTVPVQHHVAHAAACLAEHGLTTGLALVFDGTGLGPDGSIWGAELLALDGPGWQRLATFAPVPLPGGDAAVRQPLRQLVGRWLAAGVEIDPAWRERLGLTPEAVDLWRRQIEHRVNTPYTHAAGRVFDAFAAALGLAPDVTTYDGQAPIRLEAAAVRHSGPTPTPIGFTTNTVDSCLRIDWSDAFAALAGGPPPDAEAVSGLAMAFHQAVAQAARTMVESALDRVPCRTVALSGGVFMNRVLTAMVAAHLRELGLRVVVHRQVPPNDGGIALGQAVIAGRI